MRGTIQFLEIKKPPRSQRPCEALQSLSRECFRGGGYFRKHLCLLSNYSTPLLNVREVYLAK